MIFWYKPTLQVVQILFEKSTDFELKYCSKPLKGDKMTEYFNFKM